MMLEDIRKAVCAANQMLIQSGLVILTWGNVSAYDPASHLVVIKPSGISYEELTPESMVITDLCGNIVEGVYRPSSDTATHVEIYKNFPSIHSIVHTHSHWATVWSQAGLDIPPLGTTHADDFGASIPCTRALTEQEITSAYETNTGKVIVETLKKVDFSKCFAVLVREHGPFVWESSPEKAVEKAIVLEEVAHLAYDCKQLRPDYAHMSPALLKKHFERKHGKGAYYGQKVVED